MLLIEPFSLLMVSNSSIEWSWKSTLIFWSLFNNFPSTNFENNNFDNKKQSLYKVLFSKEKTTLQLKSCRGLVVVGDFCIFMPETSEISKVLSCKLGESLDKSFDIRQIP